MENLHIIATDKSPIKGDLLLRHLWKGTPDECISWWRYNDTRNYGDTVVYTTLNGSFMDSPSSFKVQHIYITNSEELKERAWYLTSDHKILKCKKVLMSIIYAEGDYGRNPNGCKKIILTTDQDLIKDGVQAITDEFLEWFIKNPSCEEVEVFQEKHHAGEVVDESYPKGFFDYKIVIPTKEPKQETLEEAASRLYSAEWDWKEKESFIEGAEWQAERMYSEEDMREAFKSSSLTNMLNVYDSFEEFIEQFKKK